MGELRGAVRSIALVTLLALAGCTSSPPVEGPAPSGASAIAPVTAATTAATTAPATGLAATDPLPSVEVATGAGPSGVAATSAAPASALPESHFLDALDAVPLGTTELTFTDWAIVKADLGYTELTSAAAEADRIEFRAQAALVHATPSAFNLDQYLRQAEAWGWNSSDLAWEVTAIGARNEPAVHVLQLRPGYDLVPVMDRYRERGFTREDRDGVTIWRGAFQLGEDWATATDSAQTNTAIDPERGRIVLLSSPEHLELALSAADEPARRFSADALVAATGRALADATSAVVFADGQTCNRFELLYPPFSTPEEQAALDAQLPEVPLDPYQVFGAAAAHEPGAGARGRVALTFAYPEDVVEEMEARQVVANVWPSVRGASRVSGRRRSSRPRPRTSRSSWTWRFGMLARPSCSRRSRRMTSRSPLATEAAAVGASRPLPRPVRGTIRGR